MPVFAWTHLLQAGLATGLAPAAVWDMTPGELFLYLKQAEPQAASLTRAELLTLVQQTRAHTHG